MDLIDRDALQRKICGAKCGCEYEDCGNEGDCEFAHFIFWAPTVDAEPVRHGTWEKYTISDLFSHTCSVCHCDVRDNTPHCPYCGAKMDGDNK